MPESFWTNQILDASRKGGLRSFFSMCGRAMLFRRDGGEFRLSWREGYGDVRFSYAFLESEPDLLREAFRTGECPLPSRVAFDSSDRLWAFAEPPGDPRLFLICELPSAVAEGDRLALRVLLSQARGALGHSVVRVELPCWMGSLLEESALRGSPVLVQGESGSGGRELVECFAGSRFGEGQVRWFSPGRLSEPVQLRELFGDSVGARLAGGGVVLPFISRPERVLAVDELARLSMQAQLRLLAYLSEGDDAHHWFFLSSLDLESLAGDGRLVPALLSLFDGRRIVIPPLRASLDFLEEECGRLLEAYRDRYGREVRIGSNALSLMRSYEWPGNWYELRRTLLAAFLMARGDEIQPEDLQLGLWRPLGVADELNLRAQTSDLEKELILHAFALHGGNQVRMAESLGISRGALQNKLNKYGMGRSRGI